jgi:CheY-like chemotaxis protein
MAKGKGKKGKKMAKKILVIDDDLDYFEALSVLLKAKGFEVIFAPNGAQGLQRAAFDAPDLILLDVMMTRRTEGFETARSLAENPATRDIPVIMVTGEVNLLFLGDSQGQTPPVKAVLEKPVKPEQLLRLIEQHIR